MILTALNNYYDRQVAQGNEEIPSFGYSRERISCALVLDQDGNLVDVRDLRESSGKKLLPVVMNVPKFNQKTSGIFPYFLWDKSSYVLGVSKKSGKKINEAHSAFKQMHLDALSAYSEKAEIAALITFLNKWEPARFESDSLFNDEMLDETFVFMLDKPRRFIHELPEVPVIWKSILSEANPRRTTCMVTGKESNTPRLHPPIRGVDNSQTVGAALASFNDDAYLSYGGTLHKLDPKNKDNDTGASVQISLEATFGYTTALNYLLRKTENNQCRARIGDTTVVFWAEAETEQQAQAGENLLAGLFSGSPAPKQDSKKTEADSDRAETSKLNSAFAQIAQGRPLQEIGADLKPDTKIYVLGLAPNAARLSVRFWETSTLDQFAKRLAQHYQDMLMEPLPWRTEPSIWRLINETVPHRPGAKPKQDDASPHLAGELARAILTGQRYPHSLLANLVMRFRADGDISSLRVALCKAVLVRKERLTHSTSIQPTEESHHKELFVSLDIENQDPGYLLGRLFAVLESVQRASMGTLVNATIRDRYYGAASATPASVFPLLLRNAQNHLGKVRKNKPGLAINLEKQLTEIIDKLGSSFAKSLGLEAQGRFAIGYYHQRSELFKKHEKDNDQADAIETTSTNTTEGDA